MKVTMRGAAELMKASWKFRNVKDGVWVFGSARTLPGTPAFEAARKFGYLVAAEGVPILTGAGPGIMEAAAKGAYENGGVTMGLAIDLPMEQRIPPYHTHVLEFKYFFTRKLSGVQKAKAFVAFEGGFGTIDEVFEVVTLMQCGKTSKRPVVLVGRDYWSGLLKWVEDSMLFAGNIGSKDLELITLVDTAEEAMKVIEEVK